MLKKALTTIFMVGILTIALWPVGVLALVPPTVSVGDSPGSTDATLSITIDNDGGAPCDVTLGCYLNGSLIGGASLGSFTTGQSTSYNVTGLSPSTNYTYMFFVQNGWGISSGGSFTTTSGLSAPSISSISSSLSGTTLSVSATLGSDGGVSCSFAIYWGLTNACGNLLVLQSGVNTGSTISGNITGVTVGTTYYYQANASNSEGNAAPAAGNYAIPNAAPTVLMSAASAVTSTTATLNGSITADGGYPAGVGVKWAYGTVSQTAADFASYTTVDANYSGTWSTGSTITKNIATLTTGVTYYARFKAHNTTGDTVSNEISFSTLSLPVVATQAASSVANTTARLNGIITLSGSGSGANPTVTFGYGTTTQTSANFNNYTTKTAAVGTWGTGTHPYLDITGLTAGTTYYFRFKAVNATGTTVSNELTFATTGGVAVPTHFVGIPTATTIKLTWALGAGDSTSAVWMSTSAFPTTHTAADGTFVYEGVGQSYTVLSLTPGQTYYFSLWGISGATYSGTYATVMVTTQAGVAASSGGATLTSPWRYLAAPNYQNLINVPFVYDVVNGIADTLGMPRSILWEIMIMLIAAVCGIWAYTGSGQAGRGSNSAVIGFAVGLAVFVFGWGIQIVQWFYILAYILFAIPIIRANKEIG